MPDAEPGNWGGGRRTRARRRDARRRDRRRRPWFADVDEAIEWCEDQVLARAGVHHRPSTVELSAHRLGRAAQAAGVAAEFAALVITRRYGQGQPVFVAGTPADEVVALLEGEVAVTVATAAGTKRLATLTAGGLLGEGAFAGSPRRTAGVTAVTPARGAALGRAALAAASPTLRAAVPGELLAISHDALVRSTRAVVALSG